MGHPHQRGAAGGRRRNRFDVARYLRREGRRRFIVGRRGVFLEQPIENVEV
jgi:hypothetical protein